MIMSGIILLTIVFVLTIKPHNPAIAFLLALAAGIVIIYRALNGIAGGVQRLDMILQQCDIGENLYMPVIKAISIAVLVRVMSAFCKDAGQTALSAKIEIIGTLLALTMCVPLLEQILSIIGNWGM